MPAQRRAGRRSTSVSTSSRARSISATPSSTSTGTGTDSRSRSRSTTQFTGGASSYNRWQRAKSKQWQWGNKKCLATRLSSAVSSTSRSTSIDPNGRRAMSVMSSVTDRIAPSTVDSDDGDEDAHANARRNIEIQDGDEQWITGITESKGSTGMRTVGIAAFQPSTATCILTQLNDSQTYIKTIHTLSVRWPSAIFTPLTGGNKSTSASGNIDPSSKQLEETQLTLYLKQTFGSRKSSMQKIREVSLAPSISSSRGSSRGSSTGIAAGGGVNDGIEVFGVPRRFFDSEAGLAFCNDLIIQDEETVMTMDSIKNKYYALSAASALFKHLETRGRTFQARSLKIRYLPLEGTMLIDTQTAKNLELVENLLDKRGRHTLFGFLNHCYTPMAARLLRSNILSPSTEAKLIEIRLDVVAEFMASEDRFKNVRRALKGLERIDADRITGSIQSAISVNAAQRNNNRKNLDPAKESERKLALMLQLRAFIKAIPSIKTCLVDDGGCQSAMLNTIGKVLDDERLGIIDEEINNTLNEQVLSSMTKTALSARTSRVFAIKAERKRLLDVARETYKENINDVDELLKDLQSKYEGQLEDVELAYAASAGFTFLMHESILEEKGGELPRIFSKLGKRGKKIAFTCVDLLKRNQRIKQSLDEVFLLSSDVLDELLQSISPHIAALYRCSEVIAMLDMLVAFAHVASTSSSYVRPEFTDTLAIKDGRHPVLERYKFTEGAFVPNDTYATDAATFQILTGPNMSGKTTFLKQIAMLVIMGQIGSYVPADYASFRLHDALLTRLSNDDSIEGNLSTFALEMQSMSMIISALATTKKALVLVDELGRGTSPQEGVGIAHAIAEEIIRSKAYCFFATHFLDLSTTLSMYPNVVSLHLETEIGAVNDEGEYDKDFALTFSHRVMDGHTTATNYGLEIAKVAALPRDMLLWAKEAADRLSHLEASRRKDAPGTKIANRRRTMLNTAADLRQAFESSRMPEYELRDYLEEIQDRVVTTLSADLPPHGDSTQVATDEHGNSDVADPTGDPTRDGFGSVSHSKSLDANDRDHSLGYGSTSPEHQAQDVTSHQNNLMKDRERSITVGPV